MGFSFRVSLLSNAVFSRFPKSHVFHVFARHFFFSCDEYLMC